MHTHAHTHAHTHTDAHKHVHIHTNRHTQTLYMHSLQTYAHAQWWIQVANPAMVPIQFGYGLLYPSNEEKFTQFM